MSKHEAHYPEPVREYSGRDILAIKRGTMSPPHPAVPFTYDFANMPPDAISADEYAEVLGWLNGRSMKRALAELWEAGRWPER